MARRRHLVTVPGLGSYRTDEATYGTGMAPTTAHHVQRSQQKIARPSAWGGWGSRTGAMGTMPSISSTQPATPFPSMVSAVGRRTPAFQESRNQMARAAGYDVPQGPPQQPNPFEGLSARQATQQLRLSPEAYQYLKPDLAAWLQSNSEAQALAEQEQQAQQALGAIQRQPEAGSAAAAPNLEELLGPPGFDADYWNSRRREAQEQLTRDFGYRRDKLEEQFRRGNMSQAYYKNQLWKLQNAAEDATLKRYAELDRERAELEQQAKYRQAQAYLQRYGTAAPLQQRRDFAEADLRMGWPSAGEAWTNMESYLRGARNDELARRMGLSQWGRRAGGGAGGGGGGATGVPAYVTWGGMRATPNVMSYGEGYAGMPMSMQRRNFGLDERV